jgi:hypothetical protein
MEWHVFKKNDPSTYPELDCPMLVCKNFDDDYILAKSHWDNATKCFIGDGAAAWNECFYAYISYVPTGYKVHHPVGCGYKDGHSCPYAFDDDGYCLNEKRKCEHQIMLNEYEITMKGVFKYL